VSARPSVARALEEALFVGDSIDADYKAAESVRIKAVLVLGTTNNIDKASDFRTIGSLEEIFQFIG
jgi:phosphoglycolate phosphatase-like HAD superfamily hydrolase